MSAGADWSRTCAGCGHIVNEPQPSGALWARCFAPGRCRGYAVGNGRYLPYVPAWCPEMREDAGGRSFPSPALQEVCNES